MKLRRSMLFVPGSNAAMLSNSFIYKPDSIMFDLEDAVALKEKDSARLLVAHALQHPLYKEIETVVRVNPLDSEFGLLDLNSVVRAGVDVVRMPKLKARKMCWIWITPLLRLRKPAVEKQVRLKC